MQTLAAFFFVCAILVILAPPRVAAFGAGDIPDFSYLNDKAFRHGDIEGILANLAKTAGTAAGSGLLGFASAMLASAKGGEKFSKMDIKRVYFGNWLRDYSQAMDIAGLSKLSADTIVMIISILGFMTFGFATEEFEVTADRLSVYLPVEHIDNPKGYAEKEGDARQFHPGLRPPVHRRELEIDERTGMKNYMATENKGWDTSTAHIRRTLLKCIERGRRAQGREGGDLWEAYRLLGTGLHTLEDLLAHSNWCEIALRKMGYKDVFCHVGDDVIVETPNGPAPPLVTGTFGSADFIHSLMGEATDHISEASVTNLYDKMKQSGDSESSTEGLKSILSKLPIGGGSEKMEQADNIRQQAYDFDPDKYAPKEVQEQLLSILKWRDGVYRDIIEKMEMIPGLTDLIEQLTNALNAYIYTILAPWLTPILQQATGVLGEGSKAVIDSDDQYEVFDNPNASDPSHSILSKDHFGLILNEPAGKIAQAVVENTVNLIVQAWFNDENPKRIIDEVLEAFHHPYYATRNSKIQNIMMDQMERWIGGLGEDEGRQIVEALTKGSVRSGKNKREGGEDTSGESNAVPAYSRDPQYTTQRRQEYVGEQYQRQNSSDVSPYSRRDENDRPSYRGRQDAENRESQDYESGIGSYSRGNESSYTRQEYADNYGRPERFEETTARSYGLDNNYEREPETQRYGSRAEEYSSSSDVYSNYRGGNDEGREHHEHSRQGHHQHHEGREEYRQEGYQPSYEQPVYGQREEYGNQGGYGDGERRARGGFGRALPSEEEVGYERGNYRDQEPPPNSEGSWGYGNNETFGAERLNLEEEGEGFEDVRRPRRQDDYY